MFQDQEFIDACSELEIPNVDGWEFFTESHDVRIYRLHNDATGLYSYKIYGELKGIEPEICSKVYMDLDYRKVWDAYVKELKEIENDGSGDGGQYIYWQVRFPFPLSNRDYVYCRELRELDMMGSRVSVILARAVNPSPVEPCSGIVRVVDYNQSLAITSNGQHGTKAYMCYYDNVGGSIPTWLINWAAKTGVPSFLSQMQAACAGYPDYQLRLASSTLSPAS